MRVHSSTDPVLIYQMLTEQWGLSPPHLVVALVGGDELAQMKPWLRDTVRKGLVKAAQSTGVPHAFINYHTHKNPQTHSHSVFRTVSQQTASRKGHSASFTGLLILQEHGSWPMAFDLVSPSSLARQSGTTLWPAPLPKSEWWPLALPPGTWSIIGKHYSPPRSQQGYSAVDEYDLFSPFV